jgi:hypothetical protein
VAEPHPMVPVLRCGVRWEVTVVASRRSASKAHERRNTSGTVTRSAP